MQRIINILFWLCFKLCHSKILDSGTIYVAEGDTYLLKCQNKTEGIFANVAWMSTAYSKGGKEVIFSYDANDKLTIQEAFIDRLTRFNDTSLRIENAKVADSGEYECNVLFYYFANFKPNLKVDEFAVYKVVVVAPPRSTQLLSTSIVSSEIEEQNEVICEATSLSPFNITWKKINDNFTKNIRIDEISNVVSAGYIRKKVLKFLSFSANDKGVYECTAENIGGVISQQVIARLKVRPSIHSPDTFTINVYDTGKLVCQATGYPSLEFSWRFLDRNGNRVDLKGMDRHGLFSTASEYDEEKETGISRLTIERVEKSDFKTFTCIAKNEISSTQKSIRLTGFAPPDAPKILQDRTTSGYDRVKLVWMLGDNGGHEIRSITIKYKNSSSSINDWTRLQITQSFTEYTINKLKEDSSYAFKVLATNEIGDGEYSDTITVSTLKRIEPTAPTTSDSKSFFEQFSSPALIGIIAGAFIAFIIAIICICVFVRRMAKNEAKREMQMSASTFGGPSVTTPFQTQHSVDGGGTRIEMESLIRADEWEFPRDRLTITTVLGAGAFGVVMRGLAQGIKGSVGQITVAVKTVRDSTNDAATKDLMAELNLLKLIPEHPNVLGLLGCCTRSEPLYVIVEYCANGDLQGFLRSSRGIYERYYKTSYGGAVPNLTSKMLLTFGLQIAKGMAHLSAMKVIHRDLAARNILVDDQLTCKVSDFGFARDIYVEDHYLKRSAGGRFPIKWMAIESLLDGISTTKSDVWSFGVVLWELITLGASPYPGMSSYEVVSFLQDGYRMDKPKHASNEVYALMMDCWSVSPGRRPSFNEIADRCQALVQESDVQEFINMNFYQDHLYVNFDGTGTGSAAVSTCTTPHGTLGRDRTNNIQQQQLEQQLLNGPFTPRTLRSPSQVSVRSGSNSNTLREGLRANSISSTYRNNINTSNTLPGRSSSIAGLSERSATGVSTISSTHKDERAALLPSIPQ